MLQALRGEGDGQGRERSVRSFRLFGLPIVFGLP
jgi:hypothetical protein